MHGAAQKALRIIFIIGWNKKTVTVLRDNNEILSYNNKKTVHCSIIITKYHHVITEQEQSETA